MRLIKLHHVGNIDPSSGAAGNYQPSILSNENLLTFRIILLARLSVND